MAIKIMNAPACEANTHSTLKTQVRPQDLEAPKTNTKNQG